MKTDVLLSKLLDKYEKSKTFSEKNKVNQKFKISVASIFKDYENDAKPRVFRQINEELATFEKRGFITLKAKHGDVIGEVFLVVDSIDKIYEYLHRTSRRDAQRKLADILKFYKNTDASPLQAYIAEQLNRLSANKNIAYFSGDYNEYEDLLKAVDSVLKNDKETFIRDLSVQLFGDSKRFETLQAKVSSILTHYGDFDNTDTVLSEYGVVKTPTYVCVKGKGIIYIGTERINLSNMYGDIAFSTETLKEISNIDIEARKVITVENLTAFHDFRDDDAFIMYLGGFHNTVKRSFLLQLYEQNKNKKYLHFGDIDVGGFYILEHLKAKTCIPFEPLHMDIETLEMHKAHWLTLTLNDRKRLESIEKKTPSYLQIVRFMLENNCKLEQEAESL